MEEPTLSVLIILMYHIPYEIPTYLSIYCCPVSVYGQILSVCLYDFHSRLLLCFTCLSVVDRWELGLEVKQW